MLDKMLDSKTNANAQVWHGVDAIAPWLIFSTSFLQAGASFS
jgi:hypothetical protein